jgi:hypothetical protein
MLELPLAPRTLPDAKSALESAAARTQAGEAPALHIAA